MRRKAGALLSIEIDILLAGIALVRRGEADFHGYAIAKEISSQGGARKLTAHGTLYRALERLEIRGLLESRWEDPEIAAMEQRPRRRMYRVTAEGAAAAEPADRPVAAPGERMRKGLATS